MKQYKLPVTMHWLSEETEEKHMAEIPILPGRRAWGYTASEAIGNLRSVAGEFVRSCQEHGHRLPKAVEEAAYEVVGPKVSTEVMIDLPPWLVSPVPRVLRAMRTSFLGVSAYLLNCITRQVDGVQ